MKIKQTFLTTAFLFFAIWGMVSCYASQSPKPSRLEQINQQIEQLEQIKKGYSAKASRLRDQSERLQFQGRSFLESRRADELAEENTRKANKVQEEIDRLTIEKEEITGGIKS